MLSIKNENVLRDSGPTNLQTWRSEVPRGSAIDQIMEDVLNSLRASATDDDLRDEINALEERNRRLADTDADWQKKVRAAEGALRDLTTAHETLAGINADTSARYDRAEAEAADLRAQLAAALLLVPGSVSLGEFRDLHRSLAADAAELERLRVFEADRLADDARMEKAMAFVLHEIKAEAASAEIPEEMFEPRYTKTWSKVDEAGNVVPIPEPGSEPPRMVRQMTDQGEVILSIADLPPEKREEIERFMEALKKAPNEPIQFVPARSRKRLDALARRAHEIADGRAVAPDTRRLADLLAALANAVEPRQ